MSTTTSCSDAKSTTTSETKQCDDDATPQKRSCGVKLKHESQFDKTFHEQLGRKLEILEEIREDAQAVGIDLPGVVVCGAQSSGKSSVLESITGINFPRGENLCTRCPAVVQMVVREYQKVPLVKVSLSSNFSDAQESNLEGVAEMIRGISQKIAGNGITEKPIYMKIIRNSGPEMTFIDLPGITHVNPEGLEEDVHELTAGMVDRYVSNGHMINLVVIPASDDFGNAEALKIAMQHDPDGVRTLGVISKIDNVPKDSDIVKKIKMQRSNDVKLAMGFVALKNRSPAEAAANMTTEELYSIEQRMHRTHPILKDIPDDKYGHGMLVDKVVGIQSRQVDKRFPEILRELRAKKSEAEAALKQLSQHCETVGERRGLFTRSVNDFVKQLVCSIEGKDSHVNLASKVTAAAEVFARSFNNKDHIPNYFGDEFGKKLEKVIAASRGHTLDNFLSDTIFRNMLSDVYFTGYLAEMSTDLVNTVHELMCEACHTIVARVFNASYPALAQEMASLMEEFISERQENTMRYVEEMLNHEKRVVFTQDKSYMKVISQFRSRKEPESHDQTGEVGEANDEENDGDEENSNNQMANWLPNLLSGKKQRLIHFLKDVSKAVCGSGEEWARHEMQLAINSYTTVMATRLSDMIPLAVKSMMVYEPSEDVAGWLAKKFSDQRLEMTMREEESVRWHRQTLNDIVSRCRRAIDTVARV